MIIKLIKKLAFSFLNLFIFLTGLLFFKSKKYVLIGAWMGTKYADNPRYLFDYLSSNKKKVRIKKVIWATRSDKVFNELKASGFDAVKIGTPASFYYHCKAKIHIICNVFLSTKTYLADIDTRLSAGAKKVQLWHGNGIKKVPGADDSQNSFIKLLRKISSPGLWYPSNMFFLCKSDIDVVFFKQKFGIDSKRCVDANYPRTDSLVFKTKEETELLKLISNRKIILYLPTFRNDYSHFNHPLTDSRIIDFIQKNDILWIEKPHSADKKKESSVSFSDLENVLLLNDTFDINLLIPLCNLLITDYSSAMLDALFFEKQIAYYTPDYNYYSKKDRGFLMDYDSITISRRVDTTSDLLVTIEELISIHHYNKRARDIKNMFWKHGNWKCDRIWKEILKAIKI